MKKKQHQKEQREQKEEKEELPLLDEINELLIKERTLLGLKVVEQQIETKEWKQKYETLINKITENKDDIEVFEIAGEIQTNNQDKKNQTKNISFAYDLDRLLHFQYSSKYSWCLNTTNFIIHRNELKKLLKYPKAYNAENITVLQLNKSDLQDVDSDLIMLLFTYPNLQCLDLSFNNLGSEFRSLFLQTIQKRRLKLQYLLLDGNMPLSLFSLESLVHHLSSQTWGLSVTLNDLENLTQYENVDKNLENTFLNKTPTLNLPPNISHTVRLSTRFLKHLNFILSPESQEPKNKTNKHFDQSFSNYNTAISSILPTTTTTTTTTTTMNKTKSEFSNGFTIIKKEAHRGPDKNDGEIQFLCFLGLTHAKLSHESINLLEQTLELSMASLTDLDLTYAFIGITGAEMLGRVLSNQNCQIIHLNLTGNSIGDHGIKLMSQSLKSTNTLTCLNLQSNDITDKGLQALTRIVSNHQILRFLIIESNPIDYNTAIKCQIKIQQSGSQTQLKWTKNIGITFQHSLLTEQPHCSPIFTILSQHFYPIDPITRTVNIYSIDSRHIRPLSKQFGGTNQLINSTLINDQTINEELILISWTMGLSESKSEHNHLLESLLKTRLAWEVKCISGSKIITFSKRTLLPNACLPIGKRVKCSTTVPCPPLYSKLEIWVSVISNDVLIGSKIHSTYYNNSNNKNNLKYQVDGGLKLECSHLIISRPTIYQNPQDYVYVGGDCNEWDSILNTRISLYDPYDTLLYDQYDHLPNPISNPIIPDDFIPLRHLRWIGQPSSLGKIQFQLKLSILYGLDKKLKDKIKNDDDNIDNGNNYENNEEDENNENDNENNDNDNEIEFNHPQIIHEPTWKTTNGNLLGYEWILLRCHHQSFGNILYDNNYEIISRGNDRDMTYQVNSIQNNKDDNEDNNEDEDNEIYQNSALNPWLWKLFEVPIENITLNDSYLLVGKVIHYESKSEISSQCIVNVTNWGMLLLGESFNGWEDILDEVNQQSFLNGVWDDPNLNSNFVL